MTIFAPTPSNIEDGARLIREGRLVAFPTETVYGLGANALNGEAVASVYAAKGRPSFNPLIVHVATRDDVRALAGVNEGALRLMATFWPGPLTIVLKKSPHAHISELATAGLVTVALRSPDHPVAQALIRAAGCPIIAPSANRSGRVSPTAAVHVEEDLGERIEMILDGGTCQHGVESTVVDLSGSEPLLLRPGAIPRVAVETVLGRKLKRGATEENPLKPSAPGQLLSHYAPRARVRLNARDVGRGEALLAFGRDVPATSGPVINLSASGDLIEAAAGLFAALRALDQPGIETIAVMPIPTDGLGEAINDRLERAAAPRG